MTPRRSLVALVALVVALILTGCEDHGDRGQRGAYVTGKRASVSSLKVHVKYGDGSRKWIAVSPNKYNLCAVGERWPSCTRAKP